MDHFTVLPVKFGTVLPDKRTLEHLLCRGNAQFRQALTKLDGLVQVEVVMLWELPRIFQEISQDEGGLTQLKDRIALRPADQDRE